MQVIRFCLLTTHSLFLVIQAFEANDVNVLVVDTEMYSNTGGQCSKATPVGASVKFAMGGKQQKKKSIGEMFMTYEHVYVASIALSNSAQTLQAFLEADRHDGPSIIIAYSPCIQQGVRPQGLNDMYDECRLAGKFLCMLYANRGKCQALY